MKKATQKKTGSSFGELSKEQQAEAVRRLMAEGHSNKSAAKALSTTPGTIAGIRTRHNIPSTHKPRPTRRAPQAPVSEPSAKTLPHAPEEDRTTQAGTEIKKYKLTGVESKMCHFVYVEDGRRCPNTRMPDSKYCEKHGE